jgi:hypothetical protein
MGTASKADHPCAERVADIDFDAVLLIWKVNVRVLFEDRRWRFIITIGNSVFKRTDKTVFEFSVRILRDTGANIEAPSHNDVPI